MSTQVVCDCKPFASGTCNPNPRTNSAEKILSRDQQLVKGWGAGFCNALGLLSLITLSSCYNLLSQKSEALISIYRLCKFNKLFFLILNSIQFLSVSLSILLSHLVSRLVLIYPRKKPKILHII